LGCELWGMVLPEPNGNCLDWLFGIPAEFKAPFVLDSISYV
jgi:hypothetical protein